MKADYRTEVTREGVEGRVKPKWEEAQRTEVGDYTGRYIKIPDGEFDYYSNQK